MEPAFRLNGTSDICWEIKTFNLFDAVADHLGVSDREFPTVTRLFPTTQFYDYTAIRGRTPPENYHLTFSLKEQNMNEARMEFNRGLNVAVVLPEPVLSGKINLFGEDRRLIDGDDHDYRPIDPPGSIIGLRVKGARGRADHSGFVRKTPGVLLAA